MLYQLSKINSVNSVKENRLINSFVGFYKSCLSNMFGVFKLFLVLQHLFDQLFACFSVFLITCVFLSYQKNTVIVVKEILFLSCPVAFTIFVFPVFQ